MLMQGHSPWLMHDQSHHIEVLQGAIFMKQNMKLGLILGRLAILKKIGANYQQLLRPVFSCFREQKNGFFKKAL